MAKKAASKKRARKRTPRTDDKVDRSSEPTAGSEAARGGFPKFLGTFDGVVYKADPPPEDRPRGHDAHGSGEELQVEIDGPGVGPGTVDTLTILRLAESYLRLVSKVAESRKAEIRLTGLRVIDKCVAVATVPSDPHVATFMSNIAADIVAGNISASFGLEGPMNDVREALRSIPHTHRARVLSGRSARTLVAPETNETIVPWEQIEQRVGVVRVGGVQRGRATFASHTDGLFTLDVGEEALKKLGALVWSEVDIEARVSYGLDGRIEDGRLLAFHALVSENETGQWREWFLRSASEWLTVENVDRELGREDDAEGSDGG